MISVGSEVRVLPGPPLQNLDVFKLKDLRMCKVMLKIFDSELGDVKSYDVAYVKYVRSRSKATTTSMDQKGQQNLGV